MGTAFNCYFIPNAFRHLWSVLPKIIMLQNGPESLWRFVHNFGDRKWKDVENGGKKIASSVSRGVSYPVALVSPARERTNSMCPRWTTAFHPFWETVIGRSRIHHIRFGPIFARPSVAAMRCPRSHDFLRLLHDQKDRGGVRAAATITADDSSGGCHQRGHRVAVTAVITLPESCPLISVWCSVSPSVQLMMPVGSDLPTNLKAHLLLTQWEAPTWG